jgi:hypothetical protein
MNFFVRQAISFFKLSVKNKVCAEFDSNTPEEKTTKRSTTKTKQNKTANSLSSVFANNFLVQNY